MANQSKFTLANDPRVKKTNPNWQDILQMQNNTQNLSSNWLNVNLQQNNQNQMQNVSQVQNQPQIIWNMWEKEIFAWDINWMQLLNNQPSPQPSPLGGEGVQGGWINSQELFEQNYNNSQNIYENPNYYKNQIPQDAVLNNLPTQNSDLHIEWINNISQPPISNSFPQGEKENQGIDSQTLYEQQLAQQWQQPNIYDNWTVEAWKSRWSSKQELEEAIEKNYNTIATWNEDWTLSATIDWQKYIWTIDEAWNPIKSIANNLEDDYNNLVNNGWTTQELYDYLNNNNLLNNPIYRNKMTDKFIADYEQPIINKYSQYTIQELHNAVVRWEIVPWTDVFNKLPQAEAYNKIKNQLILIDAEKDKDWTDYNNNLNIEKYYYSQLHQTVFSWEEAKKLADQYINDPEIQENNNEIKKRQQNIAKQQLKLKQLEDDVRNWMPWVPESIIMAEISKRAQNLYQTIEYETNMMNISAQAIDRKKQDLDVQFKFIQYQDNLKMQNYQNSLWIWQYNTNRMDQFAKIKLEQENQEVAFWRQHQADKEMFELQQQYKWTYQVGIDWSLNYIVNWQAQKVKYADWNTLFTAHEDDWSQTVTKQNADWTFSVYRINKRWEVNVQTLDMYGNKVAWLSNLVADALNCIPWSGKQCWQWVNDYLQNLWESRKFWNTYEEKAKWIQWTTPVEWAVAIRNPAGTQYGHVGVVTWVSPDWQNVYITDWNANNDEKKQERVVPASQITGNGWWYYYPKKIQEAYSRQAQIWNAWVDSGYSVSPDVQGGAVGQDAMELQGSNQYGDLVRQYWEDLVSSALAVWRWEQNLNTYDTKERGKITTIMKKLQDDYWAFYRDLNDPTVQKIQDFYQQLNKFTRDEWLLNNYSWKMNVRLWSWWDSTYDDFDALMETILSEEVINNLINSKANWATWWALSEKELQIIKEAASVLNTAKRYEDKDEQTWLYFKLSEDRFKQLLNQLMSTYAKMYTDMTWVRVDSNSLWLWEEEELSETITKNINWIEQEMRLA